MSTTSPSSTRSVTVGSPLTSSRNALNAALSEFSYPRCWSETTTIAKPFTYESPWLGLSKPYLARLPHPSEDVWEAQGASVLHEEAGRPPEHLDERAVHAGVLADHD